MGTRITSKTPKFFKVIRNIGATLTALSLAVLGAPVALPAALVTIAGYAALGGSIAAAVAQHAKADE